MIRTFTHWAHVISVCALQAEMMSYIEVRFCMCVIIQKLFLVSFFTVISGDLISSHYLAPLLLFKLSTTIISHTDHNSGRAVWRVRLKPLGCLDQGFDSRWERVRSLFVFGVLCRQRTLGVTDYSIRGRLPCVSLCMCLIVRELGTSTMTRPRPEMAFCTAEKMSRTNMTVIWLTNFKLQSTMRHII